MVLVPPLNFAFVADGVYRSGHPLPINYPFLNQLDLKSIIYFGDKDIADNQDYIEWAKSEGITLHYFHVNSAKEPFVENDPEAIRQALQILLDRRNFPILVHSNKGKHRIGVLVGVMRKIFQGWCLAGIFDEYSRFAAGKGDLDVEFIETYETKLQFDLNHAPEWLTIQEPVFDHLDGR